MKRNFLIAGGSLCIAATSAVLVLKLHNPTRPLSSYLPFNISRELRKLQDQDIKNGQGVNIKIAEKNSGVTLTGPREKIPEGVPKEKGFWSFAIPAEGVLSRSGQPTLKDFQWLKENGWKSVVNLRVDGERGELSSDPKISGFKEFGFKYLELPVVDGKAPTDEQGEQFLKFIINPENQPAHIHCRAGVGRTGAMTALYRYSVEGWPMKKAVEESRKFNNGISSDQKEWLLKWAEKHKPGSYAR